MQTPIFIGSPGAESLSVYPFAPPSDGSDCRAGLQAMIDACYLAGGGIVQLAEGTYNFLPSAGICILLRTGVWLRGAGPGTILSTDNTNAGITVPYNLIAPYGYNTAVLPYTADSMRISDLRVTGASYSLTAPMGYLHNLIAVCHSVGGTLIENVGFGNSGAHALEINQSSNVTVRNCYTIPGTGTATSKIQLDTGAGQAGAKAAVQFTATINGNTSSAASGTQITIPVVSSANCKIGDHITISGSAAAYNSASMTSGARITNVPNATSIVIDYGFSAGPWGNVSPWGNVGSVVTNTGTVTVSPVMENITIDGWIDSPSANTTGTPGREFMDVSHNTHWGVLRNLTIMNCVFRPMTLTVAPPALYSYIGFDTGSYPIELSGFHFLNNTFIGGGHSGITQLLALHCGYSATYNRRLFRNFRIIGNRTINTGFYNFLHIGNAPNSDGTMQTSMANVAGLPTHCLNWRDVTIQDNHISSVLRSSVTSAARPTRAVNIGGIQDCEFRNNHLVHENRAPQDTNLAAWASGGYWGVLIDHPINLICDGNTVENLLDPSFSGSFGFGFIFGCSAFELAGNPIPANWIFTNNNVYAYSATGVATDLMAAGFGETLSPGVTGKSSWASQVNPQVKCLWQGNRFSSTPGGSAHTCGMSTSRGTLQIPFSVQPGTAARAPAWCEAPDGTNPGRHTWGYGVRYFTVTLVAGVVTQADVLITANTNVQITRVTTGGTPGFYGVTRNVGQDFTITSSNVADTSVLQIRLEEPA